jgi:hypothetical protein
MLKNEIPNTLFKTINILRERQRPLHSNFIISRTEANQNIKGTENMTTLQRTKLVVK